VETDVSKASILTVMKILKFNSYKMLVMQYIQSVNLQIHFEDLFFGTDPYKM
jgi:hypothetical protein